MRQVLVILFLSLPGIAVLALSREMPRSNTRALLHRDLPSIYSGYKVDPYISTAANLQTLGKEGALKELRNLAREESNAEPQGHDTGSIIVLCRLLFSKRNDSQFMRPGLGGAFFLGNTDYPDWPLEPIELVDGVPFCITRGYILGGALPSPESYLDYCIQECDWSKFRFKSLSSAEKRKALDHLLASKKWKARLDQSEHDFLSAQIK